VSKQRSLDRQFEACLATWGISLLEEWDLLVFLHRHRKSLLTVEQICLLLGYGNPVVGKALGTLEKAGLVRRSRSSQGIRFNQLAAADAARQDSFELLVNLLETPLARGVVAGRLARATGGGLRRTGLYLT
jgi:DNA-binding MarR family transcriptional regulator